MVIQGKKKICLLKLFLQISHKGRQRTKNK
jgi:hypothetical protein